MDIVNSSNLDDSRDHWPAPIHLEEQTRLVTGLVNFMKEKDSRVTLLAGDVHCGAIGTIRDKQTKDVLITQFIASGMGANPPPKKALFMFKNILHTKFLLKPNLRLQMDRLPNGDMFLRTQNFLTLNPVSGRDRSIYRGTWFGVPPHKTPICDPLPNPIILQRETS